MLEASDPRLAKLSKTLQRAKIKRTAQNACEAFEKKPDDDTAKAAIEALALYRASIETT